MVVSDLQDTIYVPTLGDEIIRGTFNTNSPPFSTICFRSKKDAENFIEYCKDKYPTSKYKLVEYKLPKTIQA